MRALEPLLRALGALLEAPGADEAWPRPPCAEPEPAKDSKRNYRYGGARPPKEHNFIRFYHHRIIGS